MDANRSIYLGEVKTPFEAFVNDLIAAFKDDYQLGALTASDCIFRLNRDIRFSKDKTPYKIQMSALIKKGGKKEMNEAGLYLEIGPEFVNLFSGAYLPNKEQLLLIRQKIAKQANTFDAIIMAPDFVKYYGAVLGEKSKLLPPELKIAAQKQALMYNKQFYMLHQMPAESILTNQFLNEVKQVFNAAKAFNQFLYQLK